MSLALLFPGQGAQRPGMLHNLPDIQAAIALVDESLSYLGQLGLTDDLDTAEALKSTTNAQLALLIAGVACSRALVVDQGVIPAFVAGHSVGAFSAAVTAGVLTLPEALEAVVLRGRLMEEACAERDWGMAAVTGLPTRSAKDLAEQVTTATDPLWVANVNSATQTVFSGSDIALQRACEAAKHAGALDYELLDVSIASHCPLQEGTARCLAEHLVTLPRRAPTAAYLTNTRGRSTTSAETVMEDLAQSVVHPVQWFDAIRLMGELGATCAIETQPGHVLTRLLSSAAPGIRAIAMHDNDFATVVARTQRILREPIVSG